MDYKLSEIFEDSVLQDTCDAFTRFCGVPTAVIDLDGEVHAAAGWQEICTRFHRQNPACAAGCVESDTALANQALSGRPYNIYECKNGLVDATVPIRIQGVHVGNFFTGQFLLRDPDIIFFERQAQTYGFNQSEYMQALNKVPVFTEQEVEHNLLYLVELTALLGRMGLERCISRDRAQAERGKLRKAVADRTRELRQANAQLKSLNDELECRANTDALTGIHNRAAFDQRLTSEWKRSTRSSDHLALLIMDIDCFKQFNDRYGHPAGDDCLARIAAAIDASMERSTDFFARYGGEEFVCLLPNTDRDGAMEVAKRIQEAVRATAIEHASSTVAQWVTMSVGIGCAQPAPGSDADALLHLADQQLYRAKQAGRNRIRAAAMPGLSPGPSVNDDHHGCDQGSPEAAAP